MQTPAIARSQAAALDRFDERMEEAAERWAGVRFSMRRSFWRTAKSVLRLTPLRPTMAAATWSTC